MILIVSGIWNTWCLMGGAVWEGLGRCGLAKRSMLWKEQGADFEVSKCSLCFLSVIWHRSFQLFLPPCLLPVAMIPCHDEFISLWDHKPKYILSSITFFGHNNAYHTVSGVLPWFGCGWSVSPRASCIGNVALLWKRVETFKRWGLVRGH